ncbi:TraK protein [Pseudomonas syringae pv. cilantro]|uniref:TraK protein n=1 Tax=Pseudomonas syringae pv. cilantro TaxID=81035 RepID=A0A0N1JP36_PSESX|nr:TraK protein [Pseudomonas syringae pv. cilantro]
MAVGVIIMFGIFAKLGWTLSVCWNKFLGFLRGGVIYARPWWFRKRFRD